MRRVGFSGGRVRAIAGVTFLEAVRQRLFGLLAALALVLVAGSLFLREFNFGSSELKFVTDFGFGALTMFGTVLAIVAAAQLFFSEIDNRTALTILAKPVHRSEFVLGKFLGVLLVLLVFTALIVAMLAGVLAWREAAVREAYPDAFAHGRLVDYTGLCLFGVLQWLKFGVIAALTLLIASFSHTNLYSVIMGFLAVLVCHLQYLAHESWRHVGNLVLRLTAAVVGLVFPNFQLFNVGDGIAAGIPLAGTVAASVAGYGVIYIIVFLGLAIFAFARREI